MSLKNLLIGVILVLWSLISLGLIDVSLKTVYWLVFVLGVVYLVEELWRPLNLTRGNN
jgi:hypothetical protein